MSISELTESEGYKKFMGKLYGFGASVVLVGALFKIQHYPGASIMLIIGLLTEALIFFFSAFEPLHEELDWTLVYPELAGMEEIEEIKGKPGKEVKGKTAIERFDELLEKAGGENLFDKLGISLNGLNNTAKNLTDISGATIATKEYTENMSNAASSVNTLVSTYEKSAEVVNGTTAKISATFESAVNGVATKINASGDNYLTVLKGINSTFESAANGVATKITASGDNYQTMLQGLNATFETAVNGVSAKVSASGESYSVLLNTLNSNLDSIGKNSVAQSQQQEILTKNLSALNSLYEMQLKNSDSNFQATEHITTGINQIMQDLKDTAGDVAKYKDEISKLSKNLSALNTVYGNMLSAMNIK